jgi:hypothetical protein
MMSRVLDSVAGGQIVLGGGGAYDVQVAVPRLVVKLVELDQQLVVNKSD